ncbi:Uncharacterised protein [Mycobacteroides abscessus subsp. abscessus]|nr:Uncharacterised protein [Mycobacteroides abscessus subsp. abscessus]
MKIGPAGHDLIHDILRMRHRRIVVRAVVVVVVFTGGQIWWEGRGLVGALIAHHGETKRRKCISRGGDGGGGRADITQETVGGR